MFSGYKTLFCKVIPKDQSKRMNRLEGGHYVKNITFIVAVTALFWHLFCSPGSATILAVVNAFVVSTTTPATTTFLGLSGVADNGKFRRKWVISFYGKETGNSREAEIRRKIAMLKKEGRLKKNQQPQQPGDLDEDDDYDIGSVSSSSAKEEYGDRIRQKLGDRKSKMLGYTGQGGRQDDAGALDEPDDDESFLFVDPAVRIGQLGALPTATTNDNGYVRAADSGKTSIINPALFENENSDDDDDEMSDEDLAEIVAKKLMEKRDRERREKELRLKEVASEKLAALEEQRELEQQQEQQQQSSSTSTCSSSSSSNSSSALLKQLTTGVGGSWRRNDTEQVEMYQPKTSSWGAFPRPKDISKAYGGGRRVGPGYSNEESRLKSAEETRERLKQYREKVGIEVQSEKDHADEIEEALRIGGLAMQRGMYSTAVSALEKVTRYCSSNSKVGGKVFLELAMAYEAVGKTQEAVTVYTTLSRSRIEDIKANAKRLLYGIEAMQFMRDEMKDKSYSRKKIKQTFIDTTGFQHIAQNFDNVYQTAYIDLEGNFYKRLTESVVRSAREARQILLRATNAGEVDRMKIVQALRSLSRNFDDALEKEMEQNRVQEPVAIMDGKPILAPKQVSDESTFGGSSSDNFVLADSEQMVENLSGEWRLQLLADKRGDGVKFFNNTLSLQQMDMAAGTFMARTPLFYGNAQLSGMVEFNPKKRVLRRRQVVTSGGVLTRLVNPLTGVLGSLRAPQQVMTVDSTLLVTRGVPFQLSQTSKTKDDDKDYFAVWRRVEQ